jgi:hypothetical protein
LFEHVPVSVAESRKGSGLRAAEAQLEAAVADPSTYGRDRNREVVEGLMEIRLCRKAARAAGSRGRLIRPSPRQLKTRADYPGSDLPVAAAGGLDQGMGDRPVLDSSAVYPHSCFEMETLEEQNGPAALKRQQAGLMLWLRSDGSPRCVLPG